MPCLRQQLMKFNVCRAHWLKLEQDWKQLYSGSAGKSNLSREVAYPASKWMPWWLCSFWVVGSKPQHDLLDAALGLTSWIWENWPDCSVTSLMLCPWILKWLSVGALRAVPPTHSLQKKIWYTGWLNRTSSLTCLNFSLNVCPRGISAHLQLQKTYPKRLSTKTRAVNKWIQGWQQRWGVRRASLPFVAYMPDKEVVKDKVSKLDKRIDRDHSNK